MIVVLLDLHNDRALTVAGSGIHTSEAALFQAEARRR